LRAGKSATYARDVGAAVHRAMLEAINVPPDDRFQVLTEHPAHGLVYDAGYLGIARSDDVVFIQITLNSGRTLEQKKALYARITELLKESPGVRPEDVLVNLVEVARENWSFGNGIAQYA
jgi:4-oxalocrotonate tautomerase family enzyme